jgi:molybdenum cofactor biosynthesis enzyme MoaA
MRKQIAELKAEIVRDEKRYSEFVCIEGEIVKTTSHHGFAAACQRVRLLSEMQVLAERIRRNKIILARAKG